MARIKVVGKPQPRRKPSMQARKPGPSGNPRDRPLTSILGDSMSDSPLCDVTEWISTGSCYLNWAISGRLDGGIPIGRITEVYGGTSTGKTLIAMELAIAAQKEGYDVLYYDTEAAFSTGLFRKLGGNPDIVVYRTPETVEDLFDDLETVIAIRKDRKRIIPMLVVWDSIAASSSKEEMDKSFTDSVSPATHARRISQAMRKMSTIFGTQKIAMLAINQHRKTISSYGAGYTTFGGLAVGFYSSVRVELRVKGKLFYGRGKTRRPAGVTLLASVVKNKVSIPFQEAILDIGFNVGVDDAMSALEMAKTMGLVRVSGSWSTIRLGGKAIKFQKRTWKSAIWNKHRSELMKELTRVGKRWMEDEE